MTCVRAKLIYRAHLEKEFRLVEGYSHPRGDRRRNLSASRARGAKDGIRWLLVAGGIAGAGLADAQTTTTYAYDALGRLVTTTTSTGSGSATTTIGHDAAGNRASYRVTATGGGATPAPTPSPSPSPSPSSPPPTTSPSPAGSQFVVVPLGGFTLIPVG